MSDRNVYVAIMRARARGVGLHLTAEEVHDLSLDDAIMTVAENSLTTEELRKTIQGPMYTGWRDLPVMRPTNRPPD